MLFYLAIFVGGGLGSVSRSLLSAHLTGLTRPSLFPWGTLAVNWLGAFCIGLLITWGSTKLTFSETTRAAVITGFLGGFTTFSAFSLETMVMLTTGAWGQAMAYIMLSVGGTVCLAYAGSVLAGGL